MLRVVGLLGFLGLASGCRCCVPVASCADVRHSSAMERIPVAVERTEVNRAAPVQFIPVMGTDGTMAMFVLGGDLLHDAGIESLDLGGMRSLILVREADVARAREVLRRDARVRDYVLMDEELERLRRGDHPIIRREPNSSSARGSAK